MDFDFIEKDGVLVIEYKGAQYKLVRIKGIGGGEFIGPDEKVAEELQQKYRDILGDEEIENERDGGYWYEQPYEIGLKVAEAVGAKVIEYANEVYKKFYDDGTPILY